MDAHTVAQIPELPDEVFLLVLQLLSRRDRMAAAQVCREWRRLTLDASLWRHTTLRFSLPEDEMPEYEDTRVDWRILPQCAIDAMASLILHGNVTGRNVLLQRLRGSAVMRRFELYGMAWVYEGWTSFVSSWINLTHLRFPFCLHTHVHEFMLYARVLALPRLETLEFDDCTEEIARANLLGNDSPTWNLPVNKSITRLVLHETFPGAAISYFGYVGNPVPETMRFIANIICACTSLEALVAPTIDEFLLVSNNPLIGALWNRLREVQVVSSRPWSIRGCFLTQDCPALSALTLHVHGRDMPASLAQCFDVIAARAPQISSLSLRITPGAVEHARGAVSLESLARLPCLRRLNLNMTGPCRGSVVNLHSHTPFAGLSLFLPADDTDSAEKPAALLGIESLGISGAWRLIGDIDGWTVSVRGIVMPQYPQIVLEYSAIKH